MNTEIEVNAGVEMVPGLPHDLPGHSVQRHEQPRGTVSEVGQLIVLQRD